MRNPPRGRVFRSLLGKARRSVGCFVSTADDPCSRRSTTFRADRLGFLACNAPASLPHPCGGIFPGGLGFIRQRRGIFSVCSESFRPWLGILGCDRLFSAVLVDFCVVQEIKRKPLKGGEDQAGFAVGEAPADEAIEGELEERGEVGQRRRRRPSTTWRV